MAARKSSPWPTKYKRERERVMKREAVLNMAVEMFNEQGFNATSLDDVAARLNVTKPTIYHYFDSKEAVLFECVLTGVNQFKEALQEEANAKESGAERLRRLLMRYAEIAMTSFGKCTIKNSDYRFSPKSEEKVHELKRIADRALRQVIADGIADGSLNDLDPKMFTFTALGALNWISTWYQPGGAMKPAQIAKIIVGNLMEGALPREKQAAGLKAKK